MTLIVKSKKISQSKYFNWLLNSVQDTLSESTLKIIIICRKWYFFRFESALQEWGRKFSNRFFSTKWHFFGLDIAARPTKSMILHQNQSKKQKKNQLKKSNFFCISCPGPTFAGHLLVQYTSSSYSYYSSRFYPWIWVNCKKK